MEDRRTAQHTVKGNKRTYKPLRKGNVTASPKSDPERVKALLMERHGVESMDDLPEQGQLEWAEHLAVAKHRAKAYAAQMKKKPPKKTKKKWSHR